MNLHNDLELYHVTKKQFLESIMKDGLVPQLGENSSACFELIPKVFLCSKEKAVFWSIVLGGDTVLKVCNVKNICIDHEDEFSTQDRIAPKDIKLVRALYTEKEYKDTMKKVCNDYADILSHICVKCAEYYNMEPSEEKEGLFAYLVCRIYATITVMERLNFDVTEICTFLKKQSDDCLHTYDDMYGGTGFRLYQMLVKYPEDSLAPLRENLYEVMLKKLRGTFFVNTGQWNHQKGRHEN